MREEIETEPVGMRDVKRQRERTGREERKDKNRRGWERERERGRKGARERETERDSWLHHISLAVVECALTVYVASVVVQYR